MLALMRPRGDDNNRVSTSSNRLICARHHISPHDTGLPRAAVQ